MGGVKIIKSLLTRLCGWHLSFHLSGSSEKDKICFEERHQSKNVRFKKKIAENVILALINPVKFQSHYILSFSLL
jgi:hypothetical protein